MAMKQHEPEAAIPYWDTTLDQPLPEPRQSILWSDNLIGNNDGEVNEGPYKYFSVLPECEKFGKRLTRELEGNPEAGVFLYSDEDIEYVLKKKRVQDLMVPYDTKFEDDHAAAHVVLGGHMKDLTCAPSDPMFWFLHSFIDCVWEEFRENSQDTKPEFEYPTEDHSDYTEYHRPYHYMEPFSPIYNIHGMSNHYFNYYTECTPINNRCRKDRDCDSEFLWCDRRRRKCVSKIRQYGNCTGLDDVACYGDDMECRNDHCRRKRVRNNRKTTTIMQPTETPETNPDSPRPTPHGSYNYPFRPWYPYTYNGFHQLVNEEDEDSSKQNHQQENKDFDFRQYKFGNYYSRQRNAKWTTNQSW